MGNFIECGDDRSFFEYFGRNCLMRTFGDFFVLLWNILGRKYWGNVMVFWRTFEYYLKTSYLGGTYGWLGELWLIFWDTF